MHSGLHLPDGSPDQALHEAKQTASEVKMLNTHHQSKADSTEIHKEVAFIFDYKSDWSLRVQPQGDNYQPLDWAMSIYTACRQAGVNIDILPPHADLSGYAAIVVANQQLEHEVLLESLKNTEAQVILGPRTFSKTQQYQIPKNLAPASLQSLIPIKAVRYESLADFWSDQVSAVVADSTQSLTIKRWREFILTDLTPKYRSKDGWGFGYQHNNIHYINGCMDQASLNLLLQEILTSNESLNVQPCLGGLRQQKVGKWQFFFNYGPEEHSLANHRQLVLGKHDLAQGELAICLNEV